MKLLHNFIFATAILLIPQFALGQANVNLTNVPNFHISGTTIPNLTDVYDIGDSGYYSNGYDHITFPSHISNAAIGFAVAVQDPGGQPASGPNTAAYGQTIGNYRVGWPNSGKQGELDGLLIATSNDVGDSDGITTSMKMVQGAVSVTEGAVTRYDTSSNVQAQLDVQTGIVNYNSSTAGTGMFGFSAGLIKGSGSAAFYAIDNPSAD